MARKKSNLFKHRPYGSMRTTNPLKIKGDWYRKVEDGTFQVFVPKIGWVFSGIARNIMRKFNYKRMK